MQLFRRELAETATAILPVALVVLVLSAVVIGAPLPGLAQVLVGVLAAVVGLTLFITGVKMALLPLSERLGASLTSRGSFLLLVGVAVWLGFTITIAEPDVRILALQLEGADPNGTLPSRWVFILAVSAGVGVAMGVAMLRTVFDWPLPWVLAAGYGLVALLAILAPGDYLALAFDFGAVTTGPITVPFVLAFNIGVVAVLAGRDDVSRGFGLIAIASIGPVVAVLLVGVLA